MGYCHIWHGKILKSQWCKMITSYLLIPSTNYQGKVLSLSPSGLLLFNSVKCDSNRNSHCMNWILVINNIIYGRRGEGLIPKLILTNMGGNVGGGAKCRISYSRPDRQGTSYLVRRPASNPIIQLSRQIPTELMWLWGAGHFWKKTKLGEETTYKPQMFPWSHHTVSILRLG